MAKKRAPLPVGTLVTSAPVDASRRSTPSVTVLVVQRAPSPTRAAVTPTSTGTWSTTVFVVGSILTRVRSSPMATTHTKPSPLATDPSSMISRPSGSRCAPAPFRSPGRAGAPSPACCTRRSTGLEALVHRGAHLPADGTDVSSAPVVASSCCATSVPSVVQTCPSATCTQSASLTGRATPPAAVISLAGTRLFVGVLVALGVGVAPLGDGPAGVSSAALHALAASASSSAAAVAAASPRRRPRTSDAVRACIRSCCPAA